MAVVVGALGVLAGLVWLRCVVTVFESRLSADPSVDPHGYGLIFGTVFALPSAVVTVTKLPRAFPPHYRVNAMRLTALLVLPVTAAAIVALFTA
ncbi:hypothetical protein [Nocardia sp. NPDC058497]|uniref:hypothetical protein n=1 Tax=Nocardia sp. NPDC058497 TaxID=3346529 RepID=UPI00366191CF